LVTLYFVTSPEVMTSSITAPLGASSDRCQANQMSSTSSGGIGDHAQFASISLDIAEQEVQAAINASESFCHRLRRRRSQQGQSGGHADHDWR
jgi:multidrug efflux pump